MNNKNQYLLFNDGANLKSNIENNKKWFIIHIYMYLYFYIPSYHTLFFISRTTMADPIIREANSHVFLHTNSQKTSLPVGSSYGVPSWLKSLAKAWTFWLVQHLVASIRDIPRFYSFLVNCYLLFKSSFNASLSKMILPLHPGFAQVGFCYSAAFRFTLGGS